MKSVTENRDAQENLEETPFITLQQMLKAAYEGDLTFLKSLPQQTDFNAVVDGNSALMMAAKAPQNRGLQCATFLLNCRVSISCCDSSGNTLMHYCVISNSESVAQLLHSRNKFLINSANEFGVTPLMLAAMLDREVMADWLIQLGADLSIKDHLGLTALQHARLTRSVAAMEVITDNEKILMEMQEADEKEMTAAQICEAAHAGNTENLQNLVQAKLVNCRHLCWTPLMTAAFTKHEGGDRCVEFLLNAGADPQAGGSCGQNAMHLAAIAGNSPVVRILHAADETLVNARTRLGDTPIICACSAGQEKIVRLLIELGANPLLTNCFGHSAVDAANRVGDSKIAAFLRDSIEKNEKKTQWIHDM